MSSNANKPDARPIPKVVEQAAASSNSAGIESYDTIVTDKDIALISLTIDAKKVYTFAFTHLGLSNLEINNAAGQTRSSRSEICLKALHEWADQIDDDDALKEKKLRALLKKDNQIKPLAKLDKCSNRTFRQKLGIIAKCFSEKDFDRFAKSHLEVDLVAIMSELPPTGDTLLEDAIGVLQRWRNINGFKGATLGKLYSIVQTAITEKDLTLNTRRVLEKIYEERDRERDPQSCSNVLRRHHQRLIEDLNVEVLETLYAKEYVTKLEYEYISEMQFSRDKRQRIIMIISGHNTNAALHCLQRALEKVNQCDLARLLDSTSTDDGHGDTVD